MIRSPRTAPTALDFRLSPPVKRARSRAGPTAAYISTAGHQNLFRRVCDLSYRFDNVYLLGPTPRFLPPNVTTLPWREHWSAKFHQTSRTTQQSTVVGMSKDWDLPCKRTVALAHAREQGVETALLVDDDIYPVSSVDIEKFVSLENDLMGKVPISELDASCIELWCDKNHLSYQCLNGNYLFFDPTAELGFFPHVYNDDWLFIASCIGAQPTLTSGDSLFHAARTYDQLERARCQEFGETLVKGIYSTDGISQPGAAINWDETVRARKRYLDQLLDGPVTAPQRLIIQEARAAHRRFAAAQLEAWCRAFDADLEVWRALWYAG
jgi:hypothetical protein